jgi:hypothetical protein
VLYFVSGSKFSHYGNSKKFNELNGVQIVQMLFCEEKKKQKRPFLEEKSHMFTYLDNQLLLIAKKNLLCSLTSNQIWFTPLVDDCQSTYLKKLKNKSLI